MLFRAAINITKNINRTFINRNLRKTEFKVIRDYSLRRSLTIFCNEQESCNERNLSTTSVFSKSKDKEKSKKGKPQHVNLNELGQFINVEHLTSDFDKSIENLKTSFIKHLTLRSAVGSIEQVTVTFEGQEYVLQELANIARKPKTVVLKVDALPQAIPDILQALNKSGMNLNPQQDGTTIFIPIPKVTKEHRENLSKNAKALYIKCRDSLKDIRNKEIKNLQKLPSVSVDDTRRVQDQIEVLTNQYISKAETILETKQKELLGSLE